MVRAPKYCGFDCELLEVRIVEKGRKVYIVFFAFGGCFHPQYLSSPAIPYELRGRCFHNCHIGFSHRHLSQFLDKSSMMKRPSFWSRRVYTIWIRRIRYRHGLPIVNDLVAFDRDGINIFQTVPQAQLVQGSNTTGL